MAEIKLIQPFLNPVKFHELNRAQVAKYVSKHQDDWSYWESVPRYEGKKPYFNPWQTSDYIALQFQANYGSVTLRLFNADERVFTTVILSPTRTYDNAPGWFMYEVAMQLAPINLPDGIYFMDLTAGPGGEFYRISEPMEIKALHRDSLAMEYRHTVKYGEVFFQTGFFPMLRVKGRIKLASLDGRDTVFETRKADLRLADSTAIETYRGSFGGPGGIPDYKAKILNRVVRCPILLIEGRQYTRVSEKLEPTSAEKYSRRSWACDFRETYNSDAIVSTVEAPVTGRLLVAANVSNRGFSVSGVGTSIVHDINNE